MFGSGGYLGSRLRAKLQEHNHRVAVFTINGNSIFTIEKKIAQILLQQKFDIVINSAVSYKRGKIATLINEELPATLASLALQHDYKLLHISTVNTVQNVDDKYTISKKKSENSIRAVAARRRDHIKILRLPLLTDLEGEWIFKQIPLFKFLPIIILPNFNAKYSPIDVHLVAEKIAKNLLIIIEGKAKSLNWFGPEIIELSKCIELFSKKKCFILQLYGHSRFTNWLLKTSFTNFFDLNRSYQNCKNVTIIR
jgi:dTDP-4-dehydrorhamnose reductase